MRRMDCFEGADNPPRDTVRALVCFQYLAGCQRAGPALFGTVPGKIGFVPDFLSRIGFGAADEFIFASFGASLGNGSLACMDHGRWFGCNLFLFCRVLSPE